MAESAPAAKHHDAMSDRFDEAMRAAPDLVATWTFLLAARPVRAVVVGADPARHLMAPFDHLPRVDEPVSADLEICIWDAGSTGVEDPTPLRLEPVDPGYRFVADERHLSQQISGMSISYRRDPARVIVAMSDPATIPVRHRAKPFAKPLALWLNDGGRHLIHAGLVCHEERGVLLVGAGGAGKSNTALACLDNGLRFLADDYCILEADGPHAPLGHSIYATALLARDDLGRYAISESTSVEPVPSDDPKTGLFLATSPAASFESSAPIAAIGVCTVAGSRDSRVGRGSRSAALLGSAPDSVLLLSTRRRSSFLALSELIERTPCFDLQLGDRPAGVAAAVRSLVA